MLSPSDIKNSFDNLIINAIQNLISPSSITSHFHDLFSTTGLHIANGVKNLVINIPDPSNKKAYYEIYLDENNVNYITNLINRKTQYELITEENANLTYNLFIKFDEGDKILEMDGKRRERVSKVKEKTKKSKKSKKKLVKRL